MTAAAANTAKLRHCRRGRRSQLAIKFRRLWRTLRRRIHRRRKRWQAREGLQDSAQTTAEPACDGDAHRRRWESQQVRSGWSTHALLGRRETKLATYNCRTLKDKWRHWELVSFLEESKIDVCAIQEHRICHTTSTPQIKRQQLGGGWELVTTSASEAGVGGVGFLLSFKAVGCVESIESFSDRVLRLRLAAGISKDSHSYIISAYGPTEAAPATSKDAFFHALDAALEQVPSRDGIYLLGDLNASVKKQNQVEGSWTNLNDNSERLDSFIAEHQLLSIQSTFTKRPSQWFTHCGPKGHLSQIDHCLVPKRKQSSVSNVRTRKIDSPTSDHKLVEITVRAKLRRPPPKPKRLDYGRLCEPETREKVIEAIVAASKQNEEHDYSTFAQICERSCNLHLPRVQYNQMEPWTDIEIRNARVEVKEARRRMKETPGGIEAAAEAARHVSDLYVAKMNAFYASIASEIEEHSHEARLRAAYVALDRLTGRKARPACAINANSGAARLECLREYFADLLTAKPIATQLHSCTKDPLPVNCEDISVEEICEAAGKMKPYKAVGVDLVPSSILKDVRIAQILQPIFNHTLQRKQVPDLWKTSIFIPVYKHKGDPAVSSSYRGIALLSHAGKCMNRVLLQRLQEIIEPKLRATQCGFRPGRGCAANTLLVRRIMEDCRCRQQTSCCFVFVDFAKAYDSISRPRLATILASYGVPPSFIDIVMAFFHETKAVVRTRDGTSAPFEIQSGIIQGDTLSPYLFVVVMDFVLCNAMAGLASHGFPIRPRTSSRSPELRLTDLAYADDIALLSPTVAGAQVLLASLESWGATIGLEINTAKTKVLRIGECANEGQYLYTKNGKLQEVADFCYLGSWIASPRRDFQARRSLGFSALKSLTRLWRSDCSDGVKMRMFRACVLTVLLHGCESWSLTSSLEARLNGALTRMLRRVLNLPYGQHISNRQLYERCSIETMSAMVRQRRLQFAGHCYRLKDEDLYHPVCEMVLSNSPRKFRIGQGRTQTYLKTIQNDTSLELTALQTIAKNRDEWRSLIYSCV